MNPFIFHLFGPVSVSWYGFFIVLGCAMALYFMYTDIRRSSIVTTTQFLDCAAGGAFGGLLGGKILFFLIECRNISITSWQDVPTVLFGGFAILGAMIGMVVGVLAVAHHYRADLIAVADLGSAYGLLAHGISRVGCLIAGCCYGIPVKVGSCAVVYTHPASLAPLSIPLLPTQLIMAFISFVGFCLCLYVYHRRGRRDGVTFGLYVLWESTARFIIDFWRGDRAMIMHGLSLYQWVALGLMALALMFLGMVLAGNGRRRW